MSATSWAGTVIRTTDGESITANKPVRVFMMHLKCNSSGTVVALKNGGASGTTYVKQFVLGSGGGGNNSQTFTYGSEGIFFPNGCYIDVDSNTVSATLACRKEL